ncbi:MAG: hypothetical protein ABDH20_11160 [Thermus sp.]
MKAFRWTLLLALPLLAASCGGQGGGPAGSGGDLPPPITPEGLNFVLKDGRIRLDPRPTRPLYGVLVLAEAPDGRRTIPILAAYNPPVGENLRVITGGYFDHQEVPVLMRGEGRLLVYVWDGERWYLSETRYRTPFLPLGAPRGRWGEPGDWFGIEHDPLPPFRLLPREAWLLPPEARGRDVWTNGLEMAWPFLTPDSPLALVQTFCTPNGYRVRGAYPSGPLYSNFAGQWYRFETRPGREPVGGQMAYMDWTTTDGPPLGGVALSSQDLRQEVVLYYRVRPEGPLADGAPFRAPLAGHWWLVRSKPYPAPLLQQPCGELFGMDSWEWYYLGPESPFPGGKTPDQLWQYQEQVPFTWANPPGLERARRIQWGP